MLDALLCDLGGEGMDIHRPKYVHGWRELLKEIGIIVIGVVIALGAEQVVESLHWMYQVEAGEAALKEAFVREADNMALRKVQGGGPRAAVRNPSSG